MNIIDDLNLKNPQDYPSREAYEQDVVKAVQILMRLGNMDNPSADLTAFLNSILEKLKEDELAVYNKRSKQQIIADLKQVNSEIVKLEREIADLEWEIAIKKAEISVWKQEFWTGAEGNGNFARQVAELNKTFAGDNKPCPKATGLA
jgi:predicted  nucleic acid-binding Zn-ribbon protein